jgi:hypothetical protein
MRRWIQLLFLAIALPMMIGCGGCGSGERGKNKEKDIPKPAEVRD